MAKNSADVSIFTNFVDTWTYLLITRYHYDINSNWELFWIYSNFLGKTRSLLKYLNVNLYQLKYFSDTLKSIHALALRVCFL